MSEKWGSFGAVFYTKNASQLFERHFGEVPSGGLKADLRGWSFRHFGFN